VAGQREDRIRHCVRCLYIAALCALNRLLRDRKKWEWPVACSCIDNRNHYVGILATS
jgi:hypothetical protein